MSGNKTIPIFKIIAVLCLAVVSIVEITTMADYASPYTETAKDFDAEGMSIVFYIFGFSFLASTFFALFSLGKRNSHVIIASIEFLIFIIIGYYIQENPDIIWDADDKVTYLALCIPRIYAEEFEIVIGFSAAALVFGILDLTIGSAFSISPNLNECIYCGRRLRPGEKCTCDLDDSYVINDFDTDPVNYADDVEKRKCVFCGRLLYGTETCNCPEVKRREAAMDARMRGGFSVDTPTYAPPPSRDVRPPAFGSYSIDTPTYNPPPPRDMYPPSHGGYAKPPVPTENREIRTPVNKAFISKPPMPTDPRSSTPTSKPSGLPKSKKPGDERFFSKPSDL